MTAYTRMRRIRTLFAGMAVLLLVSAAIGAFVYFDTAVSGLEREASRLRRAGLPASVAELDRWFPRVADHENAAPRLMKLLHQKRPGSVIDYIEIRAQGIDRIELYSRPEHDEHRQLLDEVHEILLAPNAKFDVTGRPPELRELERECFLTLASFQYSAAMRYVSDEDWPMAVTRLCDLLRFANALRGHPDWHVAEARNAAIEWATDVLYLLVNRPVLSNVDLATIGELAKMNDDPETQYRWLVSWRCYYLDNQIASVHRGRSMAAAREWENVHKILVYTDALVNVARLPQLDRCDASDAIWRTAADEVAPWLIFRLDPYRDAYHVLFAQLKTSPIGNDGHYADIRVQLIRLCVAIEQYKRVNGGNAPADLKVLPPEIASIRCLAAGGDRFSYSTSSNRYNLSVDLRAAHFFIDMPRTVRTLDIGVNQPGVNAPS
jgi:hypothetical protein